MATKRTVALIHLLQRSHLQNLHLHPNPNPRISTRGLALWSMTKDPALESALSRNRRWIVNNQIKHILLRSPGRVATVRSLQKKFKTLDLQGRALNWLKKYPCCFQTFPTAAAASAVGDGDGELIFGFSKRMEALVDEEESVKDSSEPAMARRLAKLLMLSRDLRLNVVKLNELKRSFGFPDDYILRIVPSNPNTFRIINSGGRRSSMEIELLDWDPSLAVSKLEASAMSRGSEPMFVCSLPPSWIKTRERFDRFNEDSPYISPYSDNRTDTEKRAVATVHELLSLTLWKKVSVLKLEHFRREFCLPEKLNLLLLQHPCIFYVSNRYKIYTVVLREGYSGSELVEKDPLVAVKDKFGELMQEGLHEYNRRHYLMNLEKKRKRGEIVAREKREEEEEDGEEEERLDSAEKREERKRFYKVLFDDSQ